MDSGMDAGVKVGVRMRTMSHARCRGVHPQLVTAVDRPREAFHLLYHRRSSTQSEYLRVRVGGAGPQGSPLAQLGGTVAPLSVQRRMSPGPVCLNGRVQHATEHSACGIGLHYIRLAAPGLCH